MITRTNPAQQVLANRLTDYGKSGRLRSLRTTYGLVDFCSNDYLGLARSPKLKELIHVAEQQYADANTGSTGSRLLTGQTRLADEVEQELAQFYRTEAALVFNSGYDANLGLLACLPRSGDVLLTDELVHASMIDGARLCYAERHRFPHNDLNKLEAMLKQVSGGTGQVFVAVESLYSMDGDVAPLLGLVGLCEQYEAGLIVDEAHATGMFGPNGEGLVVAAGLQDRVLARVHTFGKGLGVHGATVVGSMLLRDYLINFARPFIYTTALPPGNLMAIRCAHELGKISDGERIRLFENVNRFLQRSHAAPFDDGQSNQTMIQCVSVPGNESARQVARTLQQAGFDVRAILSPTVPPGQERLRICLHAFNTFEEIDRLIDLLQQSL